MKKMKFWSIVLLMAVSLPLFNSCGSDEDGGPSGDELMNKAIGRWICTASTDIQGGKTMTGLMVGKEVSIKKDHTYTSTSSSFGYSGTYTISGNTITAKNHNGATFVVNVKIQGNIMTWNGTASNGVTFNYTFEWKSDNSGDDDTAAIARPSNQ